MAKIPISKLDGGEVATPPKAKPAAAPTLDQGLAALVAQTNALVSGVKANDVAAQQQLQQANTAVDLAKGQVASQRLANIDLAMNTNQAIDPTSGMIVPVGTPGSKNYNAAPQGPVTGTSTTGTTTTGTTTTGPTGSTLNQNTVTDYIAAAQQQLIAWGILNPNDPASNDLMNQIKTLAQQGAQTDTIALAIQNSTAYANRFSGNKARQANGLAALSPADYLSAEQNYNQILNEAGVGQQYQTQSFLANLIGKNVGTSTLQQYVNMASELANTQDPYLLQTAAQQYGLNKGDLIAHFLDPNTALPIIQQQFAATQTAAEAARQNLALNQQNAMTLAAQGITQEQARSGFANIGSQLAQQQQLANMYNMGASNISNVLTAAQFNTNVGGVSAAQAQQELTRLRAQEVNQFSGSSGAAKGSLYTESQGVS